MRLHSESLGWGARQPANTPSCPIRTNAAIPAIRIGNPDHAGISEHHKAEALPPRVRSRPDGLTRGTRAKEIVIAARLSKEKR